jgi:hypothetical protein
MAKRFIHPMKERLENYGVSITYSILTFVNFLGLYLKGTLILSKPFE